MTEEKGIYSTKYMDRNGIERVLDVRANMPRVRRGKELKKGEVVLIPSNAKAGVVLNTGQLGDFVHALKCALDELRSAEYDRNGKIDGGMI